MRSPSLLFVLVTVFVPLTSSAATITIDFTGTASIANGIWAGQGTDVTGSYTYDSDLDPTLNVTNSNGSITNTFLSNNAGNAGLDWEFTVSLGATSLSVDETDGLFNFGLFDKTPASLLDTYQLTAPGGASIQLIGSDPRAVENLNGTVPTDAPDLSLFQSVVTAGRVGTQLKWTFDSITLRDSGGGGPSVPEPTAALVFGLGLLVIGRSVKTRESA